MPLLGDYVKTDEARRLIKYGIQRYGGDHQTLFSVPRYTEESCPTTPQAFADTLKDPELLAEAKKANLDIDPISGEEVEAIVQGLYKIESAFIARMKQVLVS